MDQKHDKPMIVLSLGAGVQSSALALMCVRGEIEPMPDCAIFADTGAEPRSVYRWLAQLKRLLPFPVHMVMRDKGLRDNILSNVDEGTRFAGAPFFTESDGRAEGQIRRLCTREFKVEPITKKIRELCGLKYRQRAPKRVICIQYIGISLDEVQRMKPAKEHWIENTWPLVDARISRHDCLRWMEKNGYPEPPRSACCFFPYRSDAEWRALRDSDPEGWDDAMYIDGKIRDGVSGMDKKMFVHRSLVPLGEVDLSTDVDRGQALLWDNECEGMCGV